MNKKISIIMPTYNDVETIELTIDSIIKQEYTNWELIIVDDGSTDNTREILNKYIENYPNKIIYIYQENRDQLNAIINGTNYISGDYVYICHSDDLINEKDVFSKCVLYMNENKNIDAIISDLTLIDKNNNIIGIQKVKKYNNKKYNIPLMGLWLGRNLYVDSAFYKKDIFITKVKENYLKWNTPFWCDFNNNCKILNVKKIDFNILKYRISPSNYINNEIGKLNVINGEIRTLTNIISRYSLPCYRLQFYLYRLFNKLNIEYIPFFLNKKQNNIGKIVTFVLKKRFGDNYKSNIYLKSLNDFYNKNIDRKLHIDKKLLNNCTIYQGKDMRKFNNKLLAKELDDLYYFLFDEMSKGFNKIVVSNEEELTKMIDITKFLSIYNYVEIIKGE